MTAVVQTQDPGVFDGTPGAGLFEWENLNQAPATTQVVLQSIGVNIQDGAAVGILQAWLQPLNVPAVPDPFGPIVLLGVRTGAELVSPDGNARWSFICNQQVPRFKSGQAHWCLVITVTALDDENPPGPGVISVDYRVQPYPDVSGADPVPLPFVVPP